MERISTRLKHAWNALTTVQDRFAPTTGYYGSGYSSRPDRPRLRLSNERTIITSVYTRLSIDVAAVDIRHVKIDKNGQFLENYDSGLNDCLSVEANLDQSGRHLIQDAVLTLFDKGCIAIVPVETTLDPTVSGSYDIKQLRVGEIVQWYPKHVRVSVYNEDKGYREEVTLPKRIVAIVENPLYSVMNEPNSTLQRLIRKLHLLDAVDEQSASGKLDLIVQLPYAVKTETKRASAEQRREDIEFQLKGSKYGIAYIDGTEKVIQLNRPAENNLMKQVEFLTVMLYGELGITAEVMNGTADEATMINYFNRTIEPILSAITDAMIRKFLTKTARSQGQSIMFFRDVFKLVPLAQLAEMADKFTRNEIFSSNEFRGFLGIKPSDDPKANQLRNSNMPHADDTAAPDQPAPLDTAAASAIMQDSFDEIDQSLDSVFSDLEVSA